MLEKTGIVIKRIKKMEIYNVTRKQVQFYMIIQQIIVKTWEELLNYLK